MVSPGFFFLFCGDCCFLYRSEERKGKKWNDQPRRPIILSLQHWRFERQTKTNAIEYVLSIGGAIERGRDFIASIKPFTSTISQRMTTRTSQCIEALLCLNNDEAIIHGHLLIRSIEDPCFCPELGVRLMRIESRWIHSQKTRKRVSRMIGRFGSIEKHLTIYLTNKRHTQE